MMNWLPRWFRTSSNTCPSARRGKARLAIEALEDRTVPTVMFQPTFAGTTVTSGSSAYQYSLSGEQVSLLFAGNYWQTTQGQQDEQTLISDVKTLLASPYLSKLAQYEPNGTITLPSLYATANDATPIPLKNDFPSNSAQNNYFPTELAAHPELVPSSGSGQQQPLYVVFNDPASSGDGNYDYGMNWWDASGNHEIYVATLKGANGGVDIDQATATFSHELAEATASWVVVNDPGKLGTGSQICDNEPENGVGYLARVKGVEVQAYWSQQDSAWVVPDGSATTTTLTPIWVNGSFTGVLQGPSATVPQASTGTTVIGRQNTYVITTDGALWQHTGSNYSTGWTELAYDGVKSISVGEDSKGKDALYVQIGSGLVEHTGTNASTNWSWVWQDGIDSFSASQVQANTVFLSYNGDLEEYVATNNQWTTLVNSGVTGLDAGKDSNGKPTVFVNVGGSLREYDNGTWTNIASNVTALSASQVQANTVFFSHGSDLWEYSKGSGSWKIKASGVSAFSAGKGGPGNAVVFADVSGDLREYFGAKGHTSSSDVQNGGVISFAASQYAADTVFMDWENQSWQAKGHGANLTWAQIL